MGTAQESQVTDASARTSHKERLTPTQGRLLGYFAMLTSSEGGAASSKRELAELFHCNPKTIDRAVSRLCNEKMIEVEPRYGENGTQLGNFYRIASAKPATADTAGK